ncbi:MAG: ABC transporter transmembrane domain-containing protein [Pseudonocardia sp.]
MTRTSPGRPAADGAITPTAGRLLRRAVTGQRRALLGAVALLAGWQAAEALVPVLVGVVIDEAVATGDVSALARWLAALAGLFLALTLGFRFGARLGARAAEYAGLDLRLRVTRRILDPRGGTERGRLPGELLSIASADVSRVAGVNEAVGAVVIAASGMTVAAVVLLNASVQLGLVVLIGLPPVLALLNLLTGPLDRRSTAEQEQAANATAVAGDLIGGLRVLKGLRAERAAATRYREASRASLAARLRATSLLAAHSGATLAVTSAFLAVVALVGGRLAAQGQISIGELIAAVGLTQYLIGPLSAIAYATAAFARCRAAARRAATLLSTPPAVTGGPGRLTGPAPGALRLAGLSYGPLLGVDLEITPGELLGVVAPEPAVAAALLDCLAREVDPEAGKIELDGVVLGDLDLDGVRQVLLVAAHDTDLFEGTVAANVSGTAADPGRVPDALTAAAADEVVAALPEGAAVTEHARSLSGGQRQRVALARALATDAPVLVLHDPTTAVDGATESRIAGRLAAFRGGRTTVLIITSPALLAVTHRVVMLVDGTLVAQGTHAQLLATSQAYRDAVLS